MKSHLRTALLVTLAVGFGTSHAHAQMLFSSNSNGTWSTSTIWTPNGIPASGDWVTLSHNISLFGNQAFGNGANGSTWANSNLDLNGNNLTHVTGSTWTYSSNNRVLEDTGTLINQGTFLHGSGQNHIRTGATLQNDGTYEFTTNGGKLRGDNGTGLFWNRAGATLKVTSGTANFNHNVANQMVVQNDPNATILATTGGVLQLRGKLDERGGTIQADANSRVEVFGANNSAVAGTKWTTTGNGLIELGGTWGGAGGSNLVGIATGNVIIGEELFAASDISINLNVAAATGGTSTQAVAQTLGWHNANIRTQGNTITLNTPVNYTGNNRVLWGDGSGGTLLIPAGQTFLHGSGQNHIRTGATLQNDGTYEFTTNGGKLRGDNGTGLFWNRAGATLKVTSGTANFNHNVANQMVVQNDPNATILATTGGVLQLRGKLDERGGTIQADANSRVEVFGANNSAVAGTKWTTTGNGLIELGGTWGGAGGSNLVGIATGNVIIGEELFAASDISINLNVAAATGGTSTQAVAQTLGWHNANIRTQGNTITLNTPVNYTGNNRVLWGDGSGGTLLIPAGQTFLHGSGQNHIRTGATLQNDGTYEFTTNGGKLRGDNGTGLFWNRAGATLKVTSGTANFNHNVANQMVVQNDPNATILATTGGVLQLRGKLDERGGTIQADANSRVEVFGANNSAVAGTKWTTTGNGLIELGGTWGGAGGSNLVGIATGNVIIGEELFAASDISINLNVAAATGGTSTQAVAQTLGWHNANIRTQGNTITLNTPVNYTGNNRVLWGDGSGGTLLIPAGQTFLHGSGQNHIRQSATIQNEGTYEFTTNGGKLRGDNGVGFFLNAPGGILRAANAGSVNFNMNLVDQLTLNNQGILEVIAQSANTTLDLQDRLAVPQYNGVDTLTGGTWRVSADLGRTANLDFNRAPNNSITTLATGAEVELAGTGNVVFDQLALTTLDDGTFRVSNGYQHTGDLATTANGGTIGGDGGTIVGNVTGTLTVDPGSEFTGNPTATLFVDGDVVAQDFNFNLGIEDLLSPGVDSDLLQLTGILDLTAVTDAMLNVEDLTGGTPDLLTTEFMLMFAESDTDILGFDAGNFTINAVGEFEGELSVVEEDDGLFLVHAFAAEVPEPASIAIWSLIGLGLAGFGYYRVRRKK